MRILALLLLALMTCGASASTVNFYLTNFTATGLSNVITLIPAGPVTSGSTIISGLPIRITPANSVATTNLLTGTYQFLLQGITFPKALYLVVPDNTNTYSAAELITNNISSSTSPAHVTPAQLVAATNLLQKNFATTNTPSTLTNIISSMVGAGGTDATKMPTNNGTAYSPTFYTPTFANEVGSMTVNEFSLSSSLQFLVSGSVLYGASGTALVNYRTNTSPLWTWLLPQGGDFSGATNIPQAGVSGLPVSLAGKMGTNIGFVNALDFGADNTGATDASAALSNTFAAIPLGGRVVIPKGTYKIDAAVGLPTWGDYVAIGVEAEGAIFNVTNAIIAFDRWPADQTAAATMVNTKLRWRGGRFIGNTTAGQTAFRFGPTFGGVIEGAHFQSFTNGLIAAYGLNLEIRNSHFTYCPLILQAGTNAYNGAMWTNATVGNSQCNHAIVRACRFFTASGQDFGLGVFDSSNVHVEDCVFEGVAPDESIRFAGGWASLGGMRIVNTHLEHTPADAFLRLENLARVTVTLDTLSYPTASKLINATNCDTPIINIENVQYFDDTNQFDASTRTLSGGTPGQDGTAGWWWNFRNCTGQEGANFRDPKWWTGGIVPANLTITGAGTEYKAGLVVTNVTGIVPIANLATGTPDGTKFLRDDGTLALPSGGTATNATVTQAGTGLTDSWNGLTNTMSVASTQATDTEVTTAVSTKVDTNSTAAVSLTGPVGIGTNAAVGKALRLLGDIDMDYTNAIAFGGLSGDYSYQIGQLPNNADSMVYDAWRWHRFRWGTNDNEATAFETYRENMRIPGGLSVEGTITNTGLTASIAAKQHGTENATNWGTLQTNILGSLSYLGTGETNAFAAGITNQAKAYTDTFLPQSQTNTFAADILTSAAATALDKTNGLYQVLTNGFLSLKTNGHVAGTITMGQWQRTNTTAAITITSLTGLTGSGLHRGILSITNEAASAVLVTWPASWNNNLGFPSAYCTNACEMEIWVEAVLGTFTNAAIVRLWKSASGVAP